MIKKLTVVLAVLSLSINYSFVPANAIENGESALNHPRVVSIYTVAANLNYLRPSCSAWLYSPRIVLTAGHCVHDPSDKAKKTALNAADVYVGKPGALKTYGPPDSRVRATKIYFYETFEWYNATVGGTLSYKDDFAAIVLEKPLANIEVAKLGTKEFLDSLLARNEFIETAGYGLQDSSRQQRNGDEPKKARFQLISFEDGMKTVNEWKQKWKRSYFQEDAAFVKLPKNGAAPCDGDSGSGYFYNEDGKFTYLGVTMGLLGSPNCGLDTWTDTAVGPFRPVYLDVNMVKIAEKYVLENPYVESKATKSNSNKKVTISCIKGKTTKKVSGTNPKCPKGYKVKA